MCNNNCDEKVLVFHQSYAEAGMESNVVTYSEEESSNQPAKLLLNTGIIIWFGFPKASSDWFRPDNNFIYNNSREHR